MRTWYDGESEYLRERGLVPEGAADPFGYLGTPRGMVQTPLGPRYERRLGLCAYVTRSSENEKLIALCTTTYVTQASCPRPGDGVSPRPCPLYHGGCYGEHGHASLSVRELNESAGCTSAEKIASEEAQRIREYADDLSRMGLCPQPIRLHTVGDCPTPGAARLVAGASGSYIERTGAPVWTYTHAWNVPRSAWGRVSTLLSVHGVSEAAEALEHGYAPAMIVQKFAHGGKAYPLGKGVTGLPCPTFVSHKSCPECRLCWYDGNLRKNRLVILFLPHGSGGKQAAKRTCPGTCSIK